MRTSRFMMQETRDTPCVLGVCVTADIPRYVLTEARSSRNRSQPAERACP
jgi:hypothetical protein